MSESLRTAVPRAMAAVLLAVAAAAGLLASATGRVRRASRAGLIACDRTPATLIRQARGGVALLGGGPRR